MSKRKAKWSILEKDNKPLVITNTEDLFSKYLVLSVEERMKLCKMPLTINFSVRVKCHHLRLLKYCTELNFSHIVFTQVVTIKRSLLRMPVHLGNAVFHDELTLGYSIFEQNFFCDNATFKGLFRCVQATFEKNLFCSNAIFEKGVRTNGATFTGGFFCQNAEFYSLHLGSSQFNGKFDCGKGNFSFKPKLENSNINGGWHCNESKLNLEGSQFNFQSDVYLENSPTNINNGDFAEWFVNIIKY